MQITGALSLPCFVLLHVITIQRSLSKFQSNNTDSNTNIERILHDRFITSLKNKKRSNTRAIRTATVVAV